MIIKYKIYEIYNKNNVSQHGFKKRFFLQVQSGCDDFFEYQELSALEKKNSVQQFDSSVYVLKPSFETFEIILKESMGKGKYLDHISCSYSLFSTYSLFKYETACAT